MRLPLLAVALLVLAPSVLQHARAAESHRDFRLKGEAAYNRKDYAAARTAFATAVELRPDSPRYLHSAAALCALTGDTDAALEYLHRLAALGVSTPVERDPDFARLQGTVPFAKILRQLADNRAPQGEAEVFAELPGRTGIIEGIVHRPRTGDLFLGDVHHRCIWRRDRDGKITRFTAEDDELLGVFGLVIDEERNTLWAATSAVPEMTGFTAEMKGRTALAEFNLATGELRRVVPVPGDGRDHALGDLLVAPDGTIFATDSTAPVIWQLAPGAEEIQKHAESPLFSSLQGLVLAKRALLVADYANGLLLVDLATGNVTALATPKNSTLLGLDGLVAMPGGLVAVQNGVTPQRVLRIEFNPEMDAVTSVTVLAAGLPHLTDLSLVTLVHDRPTFIAGAGWDGFDPAKSAHPPAHTVRIFQLAAP